MNLTQKQKLKTQILNDITTLENEISILAERVQPIAPDCSLGCLIREELINNQDIDKKKLEQTTIRLKKLRYALSKINDEEYGICLDCGDDILFERLMILPESLYCVSCLNEKTLK